MSQFSSGIVTRLTRGIILTLLTWVLLVTPALADVIYTVEDGDNAWSIAVHFGVSLEDLYAANGWASDENPTLQPGQRIAIPSEREEDAADIEAESDEEPSDETTYIVQPGDNPSMIANRFGIDTLALLEYNGLVEGELIHPGQLLSIPPSDYEYQGNAEPDGEEEPETEPAPEPLHYRVQPGDTLWAIARQFGINVQTLLAYNGLNENTILQVGDELLIPAEAGSLSSRSGAWGNYTVARDDTLGGIALAHDVTAVALAEANNINVNDLLREGQQLVVPSYRSSAVPVIDDGNTETEDATPSPPPPPEDLSDEVTPLPDINDLSETDINTDISGWHSEIFDFTQIEAPEPSTPEPSPVSEGGLSIDGYFEDGIPYHLYTIRRGDSLSYVAHSFDVTQSELMERNGLDIRSSLRIGRDLRIPLPRPVTPPVVESGGSITWGAPDVSIDGGSGSDTGRSVVEEASRYMGTPYVWGGESLTGGVDCSGYTMAVYWQFGVSLPHRARDQAECGEPVEYADMVPGDLVFFHTTRSGISHVGLYIGNGEFIHSSSYRGGVVISPIATGYYNERFVRARRVL